MLVLEQEFSIHGDDLVSLVMHSGAVLHLKTKEKFKKMVLEE